MGSKLVTTNVLDKATHQLDVRLRALVAEACHYSVGTSQRQAAFSEIFRLVMRSKKLWQESTPYYADALQEMWEYCFLKVDDPEDGYRPDVCRVTTWLDNRLKKILRRYRDRSRRQLNRHAFAVQFKDGQILDPVDSLMAPPDSKFAIDMLTHLLNWVSEDPGEVLRNRVCAKYPNINAQTLLLRRLPPMEQSWGDIAVELGADKTYIAQWYSRYCNPFLREWGRVNGYIDGQSDS
ncbi:MAG: sigma-70 family RNA polymerase sigma factor [Cyanobacteria bacterium P01_D01_bin.156]